MLFYLLKCLFTICLLTLLIGCFPDPARRNEVASYHGDQWMPAPCEIVHGIPLLSEDEEIEAEWQTHKGPWRALELVDMALRNNPTTYQTWENARSAAFTWRASLSQLYPSLNFSEEYLAQKSSGTSFFGSSNDVIVDTTANTAGSAAIRAARSSSPTYNQWLISTLSLSYLIFDFGGREASIESARQALHSLNFMHNRNLQTVVLNVLTDYYLHLQAKALLLAKLDDLKDSEESVKAAQGRFEGGVATKLDVLLALSNLANVQLQLEQQKGLVKTTLGRLATSVGMPAYYHFAVADLPEDVLLEKLKHNIDELVAIAKLQRPDLAAAEATWKERQADVTVAWSEGMPTVTAGGLAQTTHNIHHSSFDSQLYNASFMLNVPIFSGFLYLNQTRSAAATASSAYAAWKNSEENVILDVVTSYYDFNTAVETVKFSKEYLTYTKEAYDAAMQSYRNGVGTILDVLTAQSALSNARAQVIQARTQWITALTNVAYATGQL